LTIVQLSPKQLNNDVRRNYDVIEQI